MSIPDTALLAITQSPELSDRAYWFILALFVPVVLYGIVKFDNRDRLRDLDRDIKGD